MCMLCSVTQLCLTLCDPHGPHGPHQAPVHGILQARILEQVAVPFSRGIFPTQGSNLCLLLLLPWQVDSLPLCHMGNSIMMPNTQ